MRACLFSVRLTLLWLVLAVVLPAAAAAGAEAVKAGRTVPVEIDDRTVQVAVPAGMSRAEELFPVYAGLFQNADTDVRAVFLPDSLLAALRAGRALDDVSIFVAGVAVPKGDNALTPDQTRAVFAYQWMKGEKILRSFSTDTAEYARVQSVLHSDPEGRNGFPLPLTPSSKVGLAIHHLEDRAGIRLQVRPGTMPSAGAPVLTTWLEAPATVIVQERVIDMILLMPVLRPTTRTVANLNRDIRAWVQETLAANDDGAPGGLAKDLESADSSESYPKLGEYVYIEELPEPARTVAPEYPEAARMAGVSGTVLVQTLVGRDGRVKDTLVVQSIPALDRAAVAAVRQWEFKPAQRKGDPVMVWVKVPVTFTLH